MMKQSPMLPATLKDIAIAVDGKSFIVLLETEDASIVPIAIGQNEALSIAMAQNGEHMQRPQTHDLILSMLELMDAKLKHIEVCDLKDDVFFGKLILEHRGIELDIDARPSDAMALAARQNVDIFIAKHVVEALAMADLTEEDDDLFDSSDAAEA